MRIIVFIFLLATALHAQCTLVVTSLHPTDKCDTLLGSLSVPPTHPLTDWERSFTWSGQCTPYLQAQGGGLDLTIRERFTCNQLNDDDDDAQFEYLYEFWQGASSSLCVGKPSYSATFTSGQCVETDYGKKMKVTCFGDFPLPKMETETEPEPKSKSRLSTGAIIGITIGVLFIVITIGFIFRSQLTNRFAKRTGEQLIQ